MAFSDRLRSMSIIDAAAVVVALVAVGGVLWSPKLSNTVARATGAIQPVEVTVDVRNTSAADPDQLIAEALKSGRTSLVIRNQPAGSVQLIRIDDIRRQLASVLPDGSVVMADDPNREIQGMLDARFVLQGDATVTSSGVVIAGTKLKVGIPVELEGRFYRVNGIVSGVSVQ
ncbi:putative conserved secreted protein [Synechococcus sp. BIOS-U3-1]|uniref:DUF4330 domain-containing protein n=1 Tax=Synechococcus sp. BIOS-U3-1 TaxID=1400865 RepID=UPI00164549C0|nr:DUF4330 domain-containing protein [Synechococcus sp. BIOS-U3-1]QNI58474.1 putative conserved secreted protein [Synechococcus sp. BIOS-U3-1]